MGGCREKLNYSVVERGDLGHQLASGFAGSGVLPSLLLGTCPCPYSIPSEVTVPTGPQNLSWNRPLTSECLSKMTGPHMRAVGSRLRSFYQGWVPDSLRLGIVSEEAAWTPPDSAPDSIVFCPLPDPSLGPRGGWSPDSFLKDFDLISTFVLSLPNLCPWAKHFPFLLLSGGNSV